VSTLCHHGTVQCTRVILSTPLFMEAFETLPQVQKNQFYKSAEKFVWEEM
jgi:hypothetical protein